MACCESKTGAPPISIPNLMGWGGQPPLIPYIECLEATTQLRGPAHSSIPQKAVLIPKPTQDKSSSKFVKNSPQFHVSQGKKREGVYACLSMSKGLTSVRANTCWGCICSCREDSGERQQSRVCLKLKECTNVWEMEGSLSKLLVLGHCCGAGVHYLNSSKHRKLIELRWNENDFNNCNVMRTSCSPWNNKEHGCDSDSQL